jgi:hypothetical protein
MGKAQTGESNTLHRIDLFLERESPMFDTSLSAVPLRGRGLCSLAPVSAMDGFAGTFSCVWAKWAVLCRDYGNFRKMVLTLALCLLNTPPQPANHGDRDFILFQGTHE